MGRGASRAGGGSGRFGGGTVDPNDVSNYQDLVSQREGKRTEVDQILTVARDLNNEYGEDGLIYQFQTADMEKSAAGAIAFYDGSNIVVNNDFFNAKRLDDSYDDCVKSGFHPSRGKKSGAEAVAAHEYGHALSDAVARKMGVANLDIASTKIVNEARKRTGDKGVVIMANKISRYASTSNAEAVAEAFADVYCNGGKAKKQSKAIVDVMNSYLKG